MIPLWLRRCLPRRLRQAGTLGSGSCGLRLRLGSIWRQSIWGGGGGQRHWHAAACIRRPYAAQPGIQVRAVQPHSQPAEAQTRGQAIGGALGAEHAELADRRVDFCEASRSPRWQWPQSGARGLPATGAEGVEPATASGTNC